MSINRFGSLQFAGMVANFLLFEVAWFAAVSGGAGGWPWLGSLPALLVVALHLAVNAGRLAQEAFLIAGITLLGVLVEGGFLASGIITYAGTEAGQWAPPIWIIALWFGFGTLPHASLGWLSGRWVLQALLGAICGPLSYVAGEALGAAQIAEPRLWSIGVIGVAWAVALPLMFVMADALARWPRLASDALQD